MKFSTLVSFHPFHGCDEKPKAGQEYLVVRPIYGDSTITEVATYMHCTFEDIDEVFEGFAQFDGSESERDQMEIYGLNSRKFKLLDDVKSWAAIPQSHHNYLDLDISITDKNHKDMTEHSQLARELLSCYLQSKKVLASDAYKEDARRENNEEFDPQLASIWDNAFEMIMVACFGGEDNHEGIGLTVGNPPYLSEEFELGNY